MLNQINQKIMAQRGRPRKNPIISKVKKHTKKSLVKSKTVKVQPKPEKTFIEPKYNEIKEYFKSKKYDSEKLNTMCMELIDILGELTGRGMTEVDGLPIDLFKMRVWVVLEKAGLLPEFKIKEDIEDDEDDDLIVNSEDDEWYKGDDEW